LHYAVNQNYVGSIKTLLSFDKSKALVNKGDKQEQTPLHLASSLGYVEATKLLLDAGVDVSKRDTTRGWNALHFAAWGNHEECVKLLLGACDAVTANAVSQRLQQTPLMVAAFYGSAKALKSMLANKCNPMLTDIAGDFAIHHAVKKHQLDCVKLLLPTFNVKYQIENGLGLTAVECGMLSTIQPFASHRWPNSSASDVVIPKDIYKYLQEVQGVTRTIATADSVRSVTEIMIAHANFDAEKEKKEKGENIRRSHYRWDGQEEQEGEMHNGLLNMPKYKPLPTENPDDFKTDDDDASDDDGDAAADDKKDSMDVDDLPDDLTGLTFSITGELSMKRADIVAILKKHGGAHSNTITKAVTHLIVADPNAITAKITKAKAEGKKIIGENALKKFLPK